MLNLTQQHEGCNEIPDFRFQLWQNAPVDLPIFEICALKSENTVSC